MHFGQPRSPDGKPLMSFRCEDCAAPNQSKSGTSRFVQRDLSGKYISILNIPYSDVLVHELISQEGNVVWMYQVCCPACEKSRFTNTDEHGASLILSYGAKQSRKFFPIDELSDDDLNEMIEEFRRGPDGICNLDVLVAEYARVNRPEIDLMMSYRSSLPSPEVAEQIALGINVLGI